MPGLSSSDLTEESVNYLVERLHEVQLYEGCTEVLGSIVEPETVKNVLLPRLNEPGERFQENLKIVLKNAGSRHGKRYLGSE